MKKSIFLILICISVLNYSFSQAATICEDASVKVIADNGNIKAYNLTKNPGPNETTADSMSWIVHYAWGLKKGGSMYAVFTDPKNPSRGCDINADRWEEDIRETENIFNPPGHIYCHWHGTLKVDGDLCDYSGNYTYAHDTKDIIVKLKAPL